MLNTSSHFVRLLATLAALVAACTSPTDGTDSDIEDGEYEVAAGKADSFEEGSAQARAILALVNDPTVDVQELDINARLSSRAARNIIVHRDGVDEVPATDDDDLYDDLAEVDAIRYVGPATMRALLDYATSKGLLMDGTTLRLPLLFDSDDHPFVASKNDEIVAAGLEAYPEFVFANAEDRSDVESWFDRFEELSDAGVGDLYTTAAPSDYSVLAVGADKGMCFRGDGEGVEAVLSTLADQPFTEMLVIQAWRYRGETHYYDDDAETRTWIDEGLADDEVWNGYDERSHDVVISQTIGDGGDDFMAFTIPPCND